MGRTNEGCSMAWVLPLWYQMCTITCMCHTLTYPCTPSLLVLSHIAQADNTGPRGGGEPCVSRSAEEFRGSEGIALHTHVRPDSWEKIYLEWRLFSTGSHSAPEPCQVSIHPDYNLQNHVSERLPPLRGGRHSAPSPFSTFPSPLHQLSSPPHPPGPPPGG